MKLDEQALEAALHDYQEEAGRNAVKSGLEAAIRAYLSALPSSPVSELAERLRDVAGPVRMNNGSFSDIAHEAASTLTTLSVRNAELERGIDRLAAYIMENFPGEPSENQGAVDTAIRLLGKNAELEREVERCHARLEIDHEWVMGGNDDSDLERREIPFAERANQIDGIECRDATIHELEREVKRLREAGENLKSIVEGIKGAMVHGTWRDEKGVRIKDTPEWVSFYLTLSTSPQGGEHE